MNRSISPILRRSPMMNWSKVEGTVQRGHQIASGLAENSPYGAGSIALQTPFFRSKGLDLSTYYPGTINLSIAPHRFQIRQPFWQIQALEWTSHHPPETFSFFQARLVFKDQTYPGLIYYPHPETKQTHFQSASILEILAPKVANLAYGDRLSLSLNPSEIEIIRQTL